MHDRQSSVIGVLGGGTIGASWATFFSSHGYGVKIYDTDPARETFIRRYATEHGRALGDEASGALSASPNLVFSTDLTDAMQAVDFVQECVPDDYAIKRDLFERLDGLVDPQVVIASSTSTLQVSQLQQGLRTANRFVVAHPFNPPHLIPLVEVVGGASTSADVFQWTARFFRSLGKQVLEVKKEVPGHVVNRLQAALFREAIWLVREGVASVKDIDEGIAWGPALRWAIMGPFLTFHLAARDQGLRGYLASFGDSYRRLWDDLGSDLQITPELVETLGRGVDEEAGGASIEELMARRDALVKLFIRQLREGNPRSPFPS